jgi:hypothetical protein
MKATVLLALLVITATASAQWTRVAFDTPDQNPATCFFIDGNTIYLGSLGAVYRSKDAAATFKRCDNGIVDKISGCTGIVKVGSYIYASFGGNGGRGIYYSNDNGDTWQIDTVGWPIMNNIPVQMFAKKLRAFKNEYVFAVLESNFTIYKRPEDSAWTVLQSPGDFRTPEDIYFDGDTIFLSRQGFGNPVKTWSADMGATWKQVVGTGATPIGTIWRNRAGGELYSAMTVYVGAKSINWLVRSTNNGTDWDTIRRCANTAPVSVDANGDLVVVAHEGNFTPADSVGRIVMSTDRGSTWSDISGNFQHLIQYSFASLEALDVYGNTLMAGGPCLITRPIEVGPTSVDESETATRTSQGEMFATRSGVYVPEEFVGRSFWMSDIQGQLVKSGTVAGTLIDLASVPNGFYALIVHTPQGLRRLSLHHY